MSVSRYRLITPNRDIPICRSTYTAELRSGNGPKELVEYALDGTFEVHYMSPSGVLLTRHNQYGVVTYNSLTGTSSLSAFADRPDLTNR